MQTYLRRLVLFSAGVLGAVAVVAGVALAQAGNPQLGTWKGNVAKSKFAPGTATVSFSTKVEAAGGGTRYTVDAATAEGALADTMEALHPGTPTLFAQNAYDCLTLLAVGAAAAKSDDPSTIASAISALTLSGTSCSDFASCTDALDAGRNIDYDGPSGALSIGAQGDPISAVFDRFTFDESGRDVSLGRLVIDNG